MHTRSRVSENRMFSSFNKSLHLIFIRSSYTPSILPVYIHPLSSIQPHSNPPASHLRPICKSITLISAIPSPPASQKQLTPPTPLRPRSPNPRRSVLSTLSITPRLHQEKNPVRLTRIPQTQPHTPRSHPTTYTSAIPTPAL